MGSAGAAALAFEQQAGPQSEVMASATQKLASWRVRPDSGRRWAGQPADAGGRGAAGSLSLEGIYQQPDNQGDVLVLVVGGQQDRVPAAFGQRCVVQMPGRRLR